MMSQGGPCLNSW